MRDPVKANGAASAGHSAGSNSARGPGAGGVLSFRLFDVRINIGLTWLIAALLIAWSLASGAFPLLYKGLAVRLYWSMAAVAVVGLAVSIVIHEMAHTLVGRVMGVEIRRVSLFLLGGVAEMENQPPNARAELLMTLAGPLTSMVLALLFAGGSGISAGQGGPAALTDVLGYLAVLNFALAGFNCLPAFPLDGGRVLRAVIWMKTGDLVTATRRAAKLGEGLGLLFVLLGVFVALMGQVGSGIWEALIGLFLRAAARSERAEVENRAALHGLSVRNLMTPDPVTAPADMRLADFVSDRLFRSHHAMFPVLDDDKVIGTIGLKEAAAAPRHTWADLVVGQACSPLTPARTIQADAPATAALAGLLSGAESRLVVMDGNHLAGVLTLKDVLDRIRLAGALA